jgi:hypothetical protein
MRSALGSSSSARSRSSLSIATSRPERVTLPRPRAPSERSRPISGSPPVTGCELQGAVVRILCPARNHNPVTVARIEREPDGTMVAVFWTRTLVGPNRVLGGRAAVPRGFSGSGLAIGGSRSVPMPSAVSSSGQLPEWFFGGVLDYGSERMSARVQLVMSRGAISSR